MKKIFAMFLLPIATVAFSQNLPLKKMLIDKQARQLAFTLIQLFTLSSNKIPYPLAIARKKTAGNTSLTLFAAQKISA